MPQTAAARVAAWCRCHACPGSAPSVDAKKCVFGRSSRRPERKRSASPAFLPAAHLTSAPAAAPRRDLPNMSNPDVNCKRLAATNVYQLADSSGHTWKAGQDSTFSCGPIRRMWDAPRPWNFSMSTSTWRLRALQRSSNTQAPQPTCAHAAPAVRSLMGCWPQCKTRRPDGAYGHPPAGRT